MRKAIKASYVDRADKMPGKRPARDKYFQYMILEKKYQSEKATRWAIKNKNEAAGSCGK